MRIQVKNPGMVLLAVLGAAALVYTFCMFLPGQAAMKQTRAEITSRQMYVMDSPQVALQVAQLEQELLETNQYIAMRQESLPRVEELSQVTGELTTRASQAGVRIVQFSPQPHTSEASLSRAAVHISVEGELDRVFDFAARMETLEAPVWCQEFTIATDAKQAELIKAEFDLLIFAANIEKSG